MMDEKKEAQFASRVWHRWQDKPGIHHGLATMQGNTITIHLLPDFEHEHLVPADSVAHLYAQPGMTYSIEGKDACEKASYLVNILTDRRLYLIVPDITAIPFYSDLFPFCRGGCPNVIYNDGSPEIVGMHFQGKNHGFILRLSSLIPNAGNTVTPGHLQEIATYFEARGYEGVSVGGIEEKKLRSTLPKKHGIFKVQHGLQETVRKYFQGGLVSADAPLQTASVAYEYDRNSGYPSEMMIVPCPSSRWVAFFDRNIDAIPDGAFCLATVTVTSEIPVGVPTPVLFFSEDMKSSYEPRDMGLVCYGGWWINDLRNASNRFGWQVTIDKGWYPADGLSDTFAAYAADAMGYKDMAVGIQRKMIKQGANSLIGRFIMKQTKVTLIPLEEATSADAPILDRNQNVTGYAAREEPDYEVVRLTMQGSYIIAEMRNKLRELAWKEYYEHGNTPLHYYTDSITFLHPLHDMSIVGEASGLWKEKVLRDVIVEANKQVAVESIRLPGLSGKERMAALTRYRAMHVTIKKKRKIPA